MKQHKDETKPSYEELLAEVKRLRAQLAGRQHEPASTVSEAIRGRVSLLSGKSRIPELFFTRGDRREELLGKLPGLIREECDEPDLVSIRILFDKKEYLSGNFKKTKLSVASDIVVFGRKAGKVQAFSLEDEPGRVYEQSFAGHDKALLGMAAGWLSRIAARAAIEKQIDAASPDVSSLEIKDGRGVVLLDNDTVVSSNRAAAALVGLDTEQMPGRASSAFFHPTELPKLAAKFLKYVTGEESYQVYETVMVRGDGSAVNVELDGCKLPGSDKNLGLMFIREVAGLSRPDEISLLAADSTDRAQREISAMIECSQAVLKHSDFSGAAESILRSCIAYAGAVGGCMAIAGEDGHLEKSAAVRCDSDNGQCLLESDSLGRVWELVREEGRPLLFKRDDFSMLEPDAAGRKPAPAVLVAPILGRGTPIGIIVVHSEKEGFSSRDAQAASAFCELAAVAYQNSIMIESLKDSEERFRAVTQSASDAIIVFNGKGDVIFWNKAAESIFGYTQKDASRLSMMSLMPKRAADFHRTQFERVRSGTENGGRGVLVTGLAMKKSGEEFPIELSYSTWRATSGDIFFTAIIRDISERRRQSAMLSESEQRFRRLADNAKDIIYRVRIPGLEYEYVSPSCLEITGYPAGDFYSIPGMFRKLVHPEWTDYFQEKWKKLTQGDVEPYYEYQILHKNGTPRWIYQRDTLLLDEEGRPAAIEGMATDITQRKAAEDSLRKSEQLYRSLAESAEDAIIIINRNLDVEYMNTAAASMILSKPEEVFTKTIPDLFAGVSAEKMAKRILGVFETGKTHQEEYEIGFPDGMRWMDTRLVPIKDASGRVISVMGMSRDITERAKMEQALKQSSSELEVRVAERTAELAWANERLTRDIELIEKADAALRESEEKYTALFNAAQDSILVTGLYDRKIRFCNPAVKRMFGYGADELIGRDIVDFCYEDTKHVAAGLYNVILGEPILYLEEFRVPRKDGSQMSIDISSSRTVIKGEEVVTSIFRDISKRVEQEKALRESEERYRTLAEAAQDYIFIINSDFSIQYVNSFGAAQFGKSPDWFTGKPLREIFPSDAEQHMIDNLKKVMETGAAFYIENPAVFPGRIAWLSAHLAPIRNAEGEITAVLGISRDITDRKRAEEVLSDHTAFQSVLADIRGTHPDSPLDELLSVFLDALVRHYDYRMAWIGRYEDGAVKPYIWKGHADKYLDGLVLDIREPDSPDAHCAMSRAIIDGRPFGYQNLATDRGFAAWRDYALELGYGSNLALPVIIDGNTEGGVMVYSSSPNGFSKERIERMEMLVGEFVNILSERRLRKSALVALKESESRLRFLTDNILDLVVIIDSKGVVGYVSPSVKEILGHDPEEYIGTYGLSFLSQEELPEVLEKFQAVLSSDKEGYAEYGFWNPEKKQQVWLEARAKAIFDESGNVANIIVVCRDSTLRRESEQALRNSEERFRLLAENSPDIIIRWTPGRGVEYVSPAVEVITGYRKDDVMGAMGFFVSKIHPEDRQVFNDNVFSCLTKTERVLQFEVRFITSDGRILWLDARMIPVQNEDEQISMLTVIARDITVKKRMEEEASAMQQQLIHAQKMEAIGTLAGGMAHDFNNILAIVMGTAEIGMRKLPQEDPSQEKFKRIFKASERAKDLTLKLLTFARKEKLNIKTVSVNGIVEDIADMLSRTISKKVRIGLELAPIVPSIEADVNQIHQALLNICINAADAMPEGGVMKISTGIENLDDGDKSLGLVPGRYCTITVRDTGRGIARDMLDRVFDPFFTTREKGTGLGLSITHGIIKSHGGAIRMDSVMGEGTTVDVFIPVSESENMSSDSEASDLMQSGSQGTIFLIDDNREFVDVGGEALAMAGLNVITAIRGSDAVALFREKHGEIDLVILDMIIPDMDSVEIFDALKEIDPGVRIILCSGYSIAGKATELLQKGARGFVQKPFGINDLLEVLSKNL